jgi:hypothetical protein
MKKIIIFCLYIAFVCVNQLFGAGICTTCDSLILKDGRHLAIKLGAIYQNKVTYKPCDSLKAKTRSIPKSEIERFVFMNSHDLIKKNKPKPSSIAQTPPSSNSNIEGNQSYISSPKLEFFSAAALIFGGLGVFPLGILLGLMGLNIIRKNPNEWYGKNYAMTGLVLSVLWIFIILLWFASII